jgi:hypothetical protein
VNTSASRAWPVISTDMPSIVYGGTGTVRCDLLDFGHCRRPWPVITSTTVSLPRIQSTRCPCSPKISPGRRPHAQFGERAPLRLEQVLDRAEQRGGLVRLVELDGPGHDHRQVQIGERAVSMSRWPGALRTCVAMPEPTRRRFPGGSR